MHDDREDAELLQAVRDGDSSAYEVLWQRHFDAALRYARRLYWARAEDLVSEAFLAIYQQVRARDNGPDFAFRLYLKAVIRNRSIRWHKEASRALDAQDVDQVDPRDGLSHLERESGSADVLAAFEALPDRWQRVLWLSEVDQAGRPAIARELGIKPNAVSALQRRARSGMKYQWLLRQVPAALRSDATHVARLLPQHLAQPRNAALAAEVAAHLLACAHCDDLLREMRSSVARAQGGALSAVLLGAVGAGLPVTASLSSGTAAVAAVATTEAGLLGWLFAGGVTAAAVGGLALTALFAAPAPPALPAEAVSVPAAPPTASPPSSAPAAAVPIEPGIPVPATPDPAVATAPEPARETPVVGTPDPAPSPEPSSPVLEVPVTTFSAAGSVSAEWASAEGSGTYTSTSTLSGAIGSSTFSAEFTSASMSPSEVAIGSETFSASFAAWSVGDGMGSSGGFSTSVTSAPDAPGDAARPPEDLASEVAIGSAGSALVTVQGTVPDLSWTVGLVLP